MGVDGAGYRPLSPDELPAGFTAGMAAELPFVDMPIYLAWLVRRVGELGGRLEQRPVSDFGDITADDADVVVNCAGLGARHLAGDPEVIPIRGQHVIVDDRLRLPPGTRRTSQLHTGFRTRPSTPIAGRFDRGGSPQFPPSLSHTFRTLLRREVLAAAPPGSSPLPWPSP